MLKLPSIPFSIQLSSGQHITVIAININIMGRFSVFKKSNKNANATVSKSSGNNSNKQTTSFKNSQRKSSSSKRVNTYPSDYIRYDNFDAAESIASSEQAKQEAEPSLLELWGSTLSTSAAAVTNGASSLGNNVSSWYSNIFLDDAEDQDDCDTRDEQQKRSSSRRSKSSKKRSDVDIVRKDVYTLDEEDARHVKQSRSTSTSRRVTFDDEEATGDYILDEDETRNDTAASISDRERIINQLRDRETEEDDSIDYSSADNTLMETDNATTDRVVAADPTDAASLVNVSSSSFETSLPNNYPIQQGYHPYDPTIGNMSLQAYRHYQIQQKLNEKKHLQFLEEQKQIKLEREAERMEPRRRGSKPIVSFRVLSFASGVTLIGSAVYTDVVNCQNGNIFGFMNILVSIYLYMFGMFTCLLESGDPTYNTATFSNYCFSCKCLTNMRIGLLNSASFLRQPFGRGLFYIFSGTLAMSELNIPSYVAGGCITLIGLVWLVLGFRINHKLEKALRVIDDEAMALELYKSHVNPQGMLDEKGFTRILQLVDSSITKLDIYAAFLNVKTDSDGHVTYENWRTWWLTKRTQDGTVKCGRGGRAMGLVCYEL